MWAAGHAKCTLALVLTLPTTVQMGTARPRAGIGPEAVFLPHWKPLPCGVGRKEKAAQQPSGTPESGRPGAACLVLGAGQSSAAWGSTMEEPLTPDTLVPGTVATCWEPGWLLSGCEQATPWQGSHSSALQTPCVGQVPGATPGGKMLTPPRVLDHGEPGLRPCPTLGLAYHFRGCEKEQEWYGLRDSWGRPQCHLWGPIWDGNPLPHCFVEKANGRFFWTWFHTILPHLSTVCPLIQPCPSLLQISVHLSSPVTQMPAHSPEHLTPELVGASAPPRAPSPYPGPSHTGPVQATRGSCHAPVVWPCVRRGDSPRGQMFSTPP